ncbi:hypothetical protein ACLBKT_15335, partial [Erythrobacter sp. W302b]|uniref:hypothetical protein n=1 Tax=Erythrobacter sp. W302b TaxID=3389874 RepID=UPI00396B23B6
RNLKGRNFPELRQSRPTGFGITDRRRSFPQLSGEANGRFWGFACHHPLEPLLCAAEVVRDFLPSCVLHLAGEK